MAGNRPVTLVVNDIGCHGRQKHASTLKDCNRHAEGCFHGKAGANLQVVLAEGIRAKLHEPCCLAQLPAADATLVYAD